MAKMKEAIYCATCDKEMRLSIIPHYEYEEGYPLSDISGYKCLICGKLFFTEEQAHELERKTAETKERTFGFDRTVTVSGKSLVVGIPAELAHHLKIRQGQKVRIIPLAKEGFLIKTG